MKNVKDARERDENGYLINYVDEEGRPAYCVVHECHIPVISPALGLCRVHYAELMDGKLSVTINEVDIDGYLYRKLLGQRKRISEASFLSMLENSRRIARLKREINREKLEEQEIASQRRLTREIPKRTSAIKIGNDVTVVIVVGGRSITIEGTITGI